MGHVSWVAEQEKGHYLDPSRASKHSGWTYCRC